MNDATEHTLKLASKPLQKAVFVLVPLVLLPTLVMDPPIDGVSFPEQIVLMARIVAATSLAGAMVSVTVFMFYRKRKKVYLNEQGIQFPNYPIIPWKRIQWYKIHIISNHGLNGMILKTDYGKVVISAEDDEALFHFKEDFKEKIALYNTAAQDFRELRSSKVKAIIISVILIAVYLTACMLMDFEKKFVWMSLTVLLITLGALWIEHVRLFKQQA
ncbi:hypothetical protein [Catalinimonas niigatensis]|uniref:hypothetical protein n=1 Tax=Catalinimonas niigatensis TaxID=1397264 RepID=UPI0026667846|nr:hypothetical protein [Catalinimonas niigatensis]WPP51387.1 hypothetical protein PZB72_03175 [Catalinimonas niigatensis]